MQPSALCMSLLISSGRWPASQSAEWHFIAFLCLFCLNNKGRALTFLMQCVHFHLHAAVCTSSRTIMDDIIILNNSEV